MTPTVDPTGSDNKDESSEEESPEPKRQSLTKTSAATGGYGDDVTSLLDMGKALRMGPRLYQGLKGMNDDNERIAALIGRLKDAGAKWKAKLPTQQDIAHAKKEKAKQDDLEGLDTSLIIESGSRRRGSRPRRAPINYNVDQDDSEQKGDSGDDSEKEKGPKKKARTSKGGGGDSTDEEEFEGDDDDDSEAEFE